MTAILTDLLADLTDRQARVAAAQTAHDLAVKDRDWAVREAIRAGASVPQIQQATRLSRARVYQIIAR